MTERLHFHLNPKAGTFLREETQGDKDDVQMGAKSGVMLPQAKEARSHEKLQEAKGA